MENDAAGFSRTYNGDTASITKARTDTGRWLARNRVTTDMYDIARLVVSELVTNAVGASPARNFELCISRQADGRLRVTVTNPASVAAMPPPAEWGPDSLLAGRGRGLAIVSRVARDVTVEADAGHVTVVAVLD
ncbi:MAG: ATP-binding protein [Acidimicrobiales bacterium]